MSRPSIPDITDISASNSGESSGEWSLRCSAIFSAPMASNLTLLQYVMYGTVSVTPRKSRCSIRDAFIPTDKLHRELGTAVFR